MEKTFAHLARYADDRSRIRVFARAGFAKLSACVIPLACFSVQTGFSVQTVINVSSAFPELAVEKTKRITTNLVC